MKALRLISPPLWSAPGALASAARRAHGQLLAHLRAPGGDAATLRIAGQLTTCALQPVTDPLAILRRSDGSELMQCHVDADGRFLLSGALPYRGVAIISVVGVGTPELRSVLVLDERSDYLVNVNPLTELLARRLGLCSGHAHSCRRLRSHSKARVQRIAHALARTFGLRCLQDEAVIPPLAADGLAQHQRANNYGQLLATVAALGWMQQESMTQILDQLYQALDRNMRLNADARVALLLAAAESGAADARCIAQTLGITELAQLIETANPAPALRASYPAPSLSQLQQLGQRPTLASVHLHPAHAGHE